MSDLLGIRDNGDGMCTISINGQEWSSDYTDAIRTLEAMLVKLQKWELREDSGNA